MHIGIDARGIREGFKGGVGEYTRAILEHLGKHPEHSYEVLSSGLSSVNDSIPIGIKECYLKIPNKLLNTSLKIRQRPYLNTIFQQKPDGIFMPNWNITALEPQVPLVVTVHDASFKIYPEVFSARMQLWHHWIYAEKLLQRANTILAVSHSTKQDVIDLYDIPSSRIRVSYPGIDPIFRKPVSDMSLDEVRASYRLPKNFLLFLGTIEPRKNIQLIIDAFDRIGSDYSDLHLVIAGKDGWRYREINHTIRHSRYYNRIHRIGFVKPHHKPALYSLAQVFIYPSLYEGFGFPPLEAMARGIPTITSSVSSFPETVGTSAIKVSPYDTEELSQAIKLFLDNPDIASQYANLGRIQSKRYSWNTTTEDILSTFIKYIS